MAAILSSAILLSPLAKATSPEEGGGVAPSPPNEEKGVRPDSSAPRPSDDRSGSSGSSLSDQLSRSGGVVQPPVSGDTAIHQPTPDPGPQSTPVIPPPGTPGGNLDVKPK